ncbi:ABSCISIC ACID-INSENSITIVE 5-like protein 2 isoform X2 [Hibiscus syriacus]|uniref:ABSCISIC ACID-INSENSITIVE 5-like protein 2 isoform X2 n=1 Tax=Hibiscus syriacus TaxID=106335 RepID=UPI00192430B7|nr:ABSCISIC ACID-INSENSITIVE 5-like protein 2 isoform X2 [Hibiscus syriacus]
MGIHTMGSQGDGGSNGKQLQCQQLTRQSSMYSLTLDEVQNQLADLGKPLNSMNLDEFLKSVWTLEGNQTFGTDTEGTAVTNQTSLQRQASLSLSSALSKKTVDEVWKDIQQSKIDGEKKSRERQPTLGEMTLEDFLIEAGVVTEASTDENVGAPIAEVDPSVAPQFAQHSQWMQYPQPPQYHHPQQSIMGIYMPAQPMPQPLALVTPGVMDVPYPENQVSLPSPLMGTLSDTQTSGRKRGSPEDIVEKTVERRQKRMIRNRESAARSRARKQAYTNELENKVSRLEEENERLRKQKELDKMLPSAPPLEPKYQLRRTSSGPF